MTATAGGRAAAIWRSRWTTALVLAIYLLLLVRGLIVGLREYDDPEHVSPAELHLVRTTAREATLVGNAVRQSLRSEVRAAFLHGDAVLNVRVDDFAHGAAVANLEFNRASPGDSLRIDLDDDRCLVLDEPAQFRVRVTIPLRRGEQRIRLLASSPGLRYRFVDFAIESRDEPAAFAQEGSYLLVHDAPTHRTWLGSGWWWDASHGAPLHDPDGALLTRRAAYLAIEPKRPGRWRVCIPYRWDSEQYPDPAWSLDAGPIVPRVEPGDRHVLNATFTAELGGRHVVGLELRGPISSPKRRGLNQDPRTIAYMVWPGRITLEPVR